MKKFRVGVAYENSIYVEVEAENEIEAIEKAEQKVEQMPHKEFLDQLNPQWAETNIIEELT